MLEHALAVAVRRVHHDHIHAGGDQAPCPHRRVRSAAHRGGHPEPAVLVLVGVRVLPPLEDVLDGDEPLEHAARVHHRQLLDPVLGQDPLGVVEAGADRGGDQVLPGHGLADRLVEVALELEIAVGDDADEPALAVHDRHARDLEPPHQLVGFAERAVGAERDRVEDHPALAALDPVDFGGLPLDRHVLVQHADAAGPRHGDGHVGLGNGVHGGGDERDVERDGAGEAAGGGDLARVHGRVPRHEQNVVEGEARLGADDGHAFAVGGAAGPDARRPTGALCGRAAGRKATYPSPSLGRSSGEIKRPARGLRRAPRPAAR